MRIAQMHVRSAGFDARRCGTACAISAIFITSSLKKGQPPSRAAGTATK